MRLGWCIKQKNGIELIERKEHLSEAYMKEADDTLRAVSLNVGKWKVITAYYSCYNAVYSLFMRAGVKCEIHDCTIEAMSLFGFTEEDVEFLRKLKADRIKNQYYLKNIELEDEEKVGEFVLKCREILLSFSDEKIEGVRNKIMEAGNE